VSHCNVYLPSRDKCLNKKITKINLNCPLNEYGYWKFFYFYILNITKFGQISLWMIATWATSWLFYKSTCNYITMASSTFQCQIIILFLKFSYFKKNIIFFHKILFFEKQISWRTPTFLKIMILASTCQVDKHITMFVFWNCNKLKLYLIYERHKHYPIFLYHGFTNLIQDVYILVLFTWLQIFEEFVET
jgi:hypothetical protein